jgi:hypothetical protein
VFSQDGHGSVRIEDKRQGGRRTGDGIKCAVRSTQYTVRSAQCAVRGTQCAVRSARYVVHSTQCAGKSDNFFLGLDKKTTIFFQDWIENVTCGNGFYF